MPRVYDPETTKQYVPGSHDDLGVHPERAEAETDQLERLYKSSPDGHAGNARREQPTAKQLAENNRAADSPDTLRDKEDAGGSSADQPNAAQDEQNKLGRGFTGSKQKLKGSNSLVKKGSKKWLIAGAGGAVGGLVAVIVIVMLFLSSLGLPNFMQNVMKYSFARFSRQLATTSVLSTQEALAVQAADGRVKTALKKRFGPTIDRFEKWRPQKVLENIGETKGLHFYYGGSDGATLTKIAYGSDTYGIKQPPGVLDIKGNLKDPLRFGGYVENAKIQATILRAVREDMKLTNVNFLVRAKAMENLRSRIGANLAGRILSRYSGLDKDSAALKAARDRAAVVSGAQFVAEPPATAVLKDGAIAASEAEKAVLASDELLDDTLKKNGVADKIIRDVEATGGAALGEGALGTTLSFINTGFAIALPLCIIYDGSMEKAGSTIDQQSNQQQLAFYDTMAVSAQQMHGSRSDVSDPVALATAVGATNDQFGDYSNSNAMQRAAGKTPNTSDSPRAQANAMGTYDYSILNALNIAPGGVAGNAVNKLVSGGCSAITDMRTVVGLAAGNILLDIFTGGGKVLLEKGVEKGVTSFITSYIKLKFTSMLETAVAKSIIKKTAKDSLSTVETNSITRMARFVIGSKALGVGAVKQGAIIGGTYGLTELARLITYTRAGQLTSGLSMGTDNANNVDSGGIIAGNEASRSITFGAPLTPESIVLSQQADAIYLADQQKNLSFFTRYFALTNAGSLASRMAIGMKISLNSGLLQTISNIGTTILNPLRYFGSFINNLSPTVKAQAAGSDSYYGNTQFGWTEQEEALIINNQDKYGMAINKEYLRLSGRSDDIAANYGKCFTSSLGELFSQRMIERDDRGDVVDNPELPCSPSNLGRNNTQGFGDLVFRWRLDGRYENSFAHLEDLSKVTTGVAPVGSNSPTGSDLGAPVGTADVAALAKQILALRDSGKITIADYSSNKAADSATRSLASQQLEDMAAGKPVGITTRCAYQMPATITPHPSLLKFLVDYGNQYHYKINSLFGQCHSAGSQHGRGQAVDFGCPANVQLGDSIGQKYNVVRFLGESCGGPGNHWHYSLGRTP
ncbi:hypothetical protein IPL85_01975 [Candidatus Saccharibacteria bacterium]|nr:MAG: hypothetical protein IPL85_01975 [Candidatus Saccharibacteria bacterium]